MTSINVCFPQERYICDNALYILKALGITENVALAECFKTIISMKTFYDSLFKYNRVCNDESIKVAMANPENISNKCLELLSHLHNVHAIWNSRILGEADPVKSWEHHDLAMLPQLNAENSRISLEIVAQRSLNETIEFQTANGDTFYATIRDILFQIINHSTYHRGQIAVEFRKRGLEPLLTDYMLYKMNE